MDIVEVARKRLEQCIDDDADNLKKMQDDIRFCTLDQWDESIRSARENDPNGPRPCLTIDKINQYIVQVVNDMRQNRPSIKTRPVDDKSDVEVAKILQGIIRHIEDQSNASIAYETAGDWAVKCGRGYFRIITDYENEDSFDQEIRIVPVTNAFKTYLGPHNMPDGSDAQYGFIAESIKKEDFKEEYPKAKTDQAAFEGLDDAWVTEDEITVAEYFYMENIKKKIYFLEDGSVTTKPDGKPVNKERETISKKVKWVKMTGVEVLEEREWAGSYIPIIEVIGKEQVIDGKRVLWGLVRPAKDNLRMYNYWMSAATEKIALSPKTPFIGASGQFEGHEEKWRKANTENRAYLEYNPVDVNGNALPTPKRVEPAPMETAIIQMMTTIENDTRSTLGMYKASVGDSVSQQSGRALLALERSSDTGTYHFADNLANSIRYAGKQLIDLIPKIYDTPRIMRILGEDGSVESAEIDPNQESPVMRKSTPEGMKNVYNLGIGKYDVSVSVGPSYNTKRMEAAQIFSELSNSAKDPNSAAILQYLTIKNSDLTSSDEAIAMLKSVLPPQAQQVEKMGKIPPQIMAKLQEMTQQLQQMQEAGQQLQQENQQLKSGAMESQAKIKQSGEEKMAELELKQKIQAAELQLAREKADAEMKLKYDIAQADIELEKLKLSVTKDGEIDKAISTVQNMIVKHEANMTSMIGDVSRETNETEENVDTGSLMQMHQDFMNSINQVINGLNQKKTINLIKEDGMTVGAEVITTPTTLQ